MENNKGSWLSSFWHSLNLPPFLDQYGLYGVWGLLVLVPLIVIVLVVKGCG